MLLDTTIAQEREKLHGYSWASEVGDSDLLRDQCKGVGWQCRHPAVHDPDLTIPKIQWDYEQQDFPVDLSAQASHAKRHLSASIGIHDNLTLNEIKLWPYTPSEALAKIGKLDIGYPSDLNHWGITFRFIRKDGHICEVEMLLDGHISQVNIPPAFERKQPEQK
jgi:hypothetical protein